ncbi:MAG: ABC transporter permease [Micromonosporaceae bacterium]
MIASFRAELLRLTKWPATWVLSALWLLLNLSFAYVFPYLSYRSAVADGDTRVADALLADVSMAELPATLVQGLPMFGGAIVMILAALATGSGFGWSTWKTVHTQGPTRVAAISGTLAALGAIISGVVLATLAADMAGSATVMALESESISWPAGFDVAESVGASLLITGMFGCFGAVLGVLTRGPALSVGLGLVWALVVENLLRGVAGLLGPVEVVTNVLPGTAAGSLAGALGAAGESTGAGQDGTPGVLSILEGDVATWLLFGYAVAFIVVLAAVVRRRDI